MRGWRRKDKLVQDDLRIIQLLVITVDDFLADEFIAFIMPNGQRDPVGAGCSAFRLEVPPRSAAGIHA